MYMPEGLEKCNDPMATIDPDYVATIKYRGQTVNLYIDDYGQCFYVRGTVCGRAIECGLGTYGFSPEWDVADLIDSLIKDEERYQQWKAEHPDEADKD